MWKRLVPTRWARIISWTTASLVWATTVLIAHDLGDAPTPAALEPAIPEPVSVETVVSEPTPLPAAPTDGLVVLRFTPVPPPPPQEIIRTVVSPAAQPTQAPRVVSAGS